MLPFLKKEFTMKTHILGVLAAAALVAGCASGPPPATEFPSGARAPTAAEITSLLRGKSFNLANRDGSSTQANHGANDSVIAFFGGRSDSGTWRAEDGRVCYQFKVVPSACNDLRLVGSDAYLKRSNGQVVKLEPR